MGAIHVGLWQGSERWSNGGIARLLEKFEAAAREQMFPAIVFPGHDGAEVGRITRLTDDFRGVAFSGELDDGSSGAVQSRLRHVGVMAVSPTIRNLRAVRDPRFDHMERQMCIDGFLWDVAILDVEVPAYAGSWIRLGTDVSDLQTAGVG